MSVVQHVIQTQPIMQFLHVLQPPVTEMLIIKVVAAQVVIHVIQMVEVEVEFFEINCPNNFITDCTY